MVGAPRPQPEFFWQYHTFVNPVLAAKYPPGHSLLLTIGVWFGAPWLVPVTCAGLGAAVLFALSRRWTTRNAALLAVGIAATSQIWLRFSPSYFSETTTAALFLISWFALANHWQNGRLRWLALLAAGVGLGAITRPLTMLAFALPTGVAALWSLRLHRAWRQIPIALLVVAMFGGLALVWDARVTGNWRLSPHAEYARRYSPADRMGFSLDASEPADTLSSEQRWYAQAIRRIHEEHSVARLGTIAMRRGAQLADVATSFRGLPLLLALVAFAVLPIGVFAVAMGTVVSVFVAYFAYAHLASWTLYYLELEAPLAFLTAVGVLVVTRRTASGLSRLSRQRADPQRAERVAFAILSAVLVIPGAAMSIPFRRAHVDDRRLADAFARATQTLPSRPIVAFVRERMDRHPEQSVVQNVVDLKGARIWTVHDEGALDSRLTAIAPTRAAYLIEETRTGDSIRFMVRPLDQSPKPLP
jgi:hypothetical protein